MSQPLSAMTAAPISVLLVDCAAATETMEVAAAWRERLTELKRSFEIIVVGPETNAELLLLRDALLPSGGDCRVVTYAEPEGDGPALRAASAAARHPLLLFSTGDKQYRPNDIEPFLTLINEVDVVCGQRVGQPLPGWLMLFDDVKRVLARIVLGYLPPARQGWLGSRGWGRRFLARWMFGLRLQDIECRLRLFRKAALEPFPIQSRGSFAHIEVLAKANHLGRLMAEAPVTWVPPAVQPGDPTFRGDALRVFRQPEFHDPTKPSEAAVAKGPAEGENVAGPT
jgi:hypothetical protein